MGLEPAAAFTGLDIWRDAKARPVLPNTAYQHVLHSYFNHCPESPDGRWVLMFLSPQDDAHLGDVVILERHTGQLITLATQVTTEDAHRQAYQQWIAGGRYVIFQNLVQDHWQIERVDIVSLKREVIHRDRLLGWSQPLSDFAMLYPPHWQTNTNRDIECLDVHTGQVRKAILAEDVYPKVKSLIDKRLPDVDVKNISLFFPILSPDQSRVMFKLASPSGDGFQAESASRRVGLIVWDIANNQFVACGDQWGHPSWHPDSKQIAKVTNQLLDGDTLATRPILDLPHFHGSHPSISPDGQWYVTDVLLHTFNGKPNQWGVALASMKTGQWRFIHRNETAEAGTTSWRPPHPHSTFNAQSNRIYFNANHHRSMQLHVLDSSGEAEAQAV